MTESKKQINLTRRDLQVRVTWEVGVPYDVICSRLGISSGELRSCLRRLREAGEETAPRPFFRKGMEKFDPESINWEEFLSVSDLPTSPQRSSPAKAYLRHLQGEKIVIIALKMGLKVKEVKSLIEGYRQTRNLEP